MKRRLLKLFIIGILIVIIMPSCMTTRTSVGTYSEKDGVEYLYSKGKQWYILFGLYPISRKETVTKDGATSIRKKEIVKTPEDGICLIKTEERFLSYLLKYVTEGFVRLQNVYVYVKYDPGYYKVGDSVYLLRGVNGEKVKAEIQEISKNYVRLRVVENTEYRMKYDFIDVTYSKIEKIENTNQ